MDREIAKAESVIAKLKKKQLELEEAANKTNETDEKNSMLLNEEERRKAREEEERPKSLAQMVYAENRVRWEKKDFQRF